MRLTSSDRLCIPVPLYHCFGMVLGNLACITHGATMVYPSEAFEPLAVLETIEANDVPRCMGCQRCSLLSSTIRSLISSISLVCDRDYGRLTLSD
jgi:acyl-CoA synthetase (AMP-forming)/AMP-acid ligase II